MPTLFGVGKLLKFSKRDRMVLLNGTSSLFQLVLALAEQSHRRLYETEKISSGSLLHHIDFNRIAQLFRG